MRKQQQANMLTPYVLARDHSQMVRTPDGATMFVYATGAQTGNTVAVVEFIFPPGGGFPMHIHHNEDEALYILEGTLLVVCGETRSEAGPGTFIYGPRNIPHGYRVLGDVPVRFVESFLPSGLEQFFLTIGKPITGQTGQEVKEVFKPSMKALLAEKYHVDIVGPIPQ